MNIKVEGCIMSVARYVDDCTDGYADGQLERTAEKVTKTSFALGRLCDILINKGLLTLDELREVTEGYKRIEAAE